MGFVNEGWFGILAGAVIGTVTSIYFYRKSIKAPVLSYMIQGLQAFRLAGPKDVLQDLDVLYDGQGENLTVVSITFWNSGNAILEGSTLVQRDPLRLSLLPGTGEFLYPEIVQNPNAHCNIVLKESSERTSVEILFDFLDKKDGVVIRVLHTAAEPDIKIEGTLKGVSIVPYRDPLPEKNAWSCLPR